MLIWWMFVCYVASHIDDVPCYPSPHQNNNNNNSNSNSASNHNNNDDSASMSPNTLSQSTHVMYLRASGVYKGKSVWFCSKRMIDMAASIDALSYTCNEKTQRHSPHISVSLL
jgi:hypothetical protein